MSQLKLPQNPEFHFNIRDFIWQRERAAEQTKAKHQNLCTIRQRRNIASKSVHIAGKGGKIEICAYRREADNDYKGRNLKVWRTMMKRRETRQKKCRLCRYISSVSFHKYFRNQPRMNIHKAISKWFGKNAFKYVISVFQLFVNLHLGLGKNPQKSPKFERIIQELPRHGQEPLRVWLRVLGVIAQIMTLSPQAGRSPCVPCNTLDEQR